MSRVKRVRLVRFAALSAVVLASFAAPTARTLSSPSPGLYLDVPGNTSDDARVKLRGVMVTNVRQKGTWKMVVSQGFAGTAVVGSINGAHASVRAPSGDVTFYLYLDTHATPSNQMSMTDAMNMMNGEGIPANVRSADDFVLLHLTVKDNGREAQVGTSGRGGMSNKSKDAVPCTVEKLGDGAFRVKPSTPLAPGEYAFSTMGQGNASELWDFGVDGK